MLEKLAYQSRVSEIADVVIRINGAYKANNCGGDANLATFFTELEPLSARHTAAIKRTNEESVLEELDDERDDDIRGVSTILKGLCYHPDPAVQISAQKVLKVFNNFGVSITEENYSSESGHINSLLDDLKMPKIKAVIDELPLVSEYILALNTSQANFEQQNIAYDAVKAREGTWVTASALKKEIIALINNKIVDYLRIMVPLNDAVYGEFARTLAKVISENNKTVEKRRNKGDKPEGGEEN